MQRKNSHTRLKGILLSKATVGKKNVEVLQRTKTVFSYEPSISLIGIYIKKTTLHSTEISEHHVYWSNSHKMHDIEELRHTLTEKSKYTKSVD